MAIACFDLIIRVAPTETATNERIVDIDLFRLQAGRFRCRFECLVRRLRSDPNIEPIGLQIHGRIHRLHRRMRQIRRLVDCLKRLCRAREGRFDIAVIYAPLP